jgi:hypothetical protein
MTIFTLTDGKRVAIAAFDVHRVYSTGEPNSCSVVYQRQIEGSEWAEETITVVGTFDSIMSDIEESNK